MTTLLARGALALSIFAGSLALWIAVPIGSLWVASKLIHDTTMTALSAVAVAPFAMLGVGLLLAKLHGVYLSVSGAHPARRAASWRESLSGDRRPRRPRSVLELSLILSLVIALIALTVWFFFLAHNPTPMAPGGF
jgi:hypothetical protein